MADANDIIKRLDLKPLPEEGGYYRETYRGAPNNLPAQLFGITSSSNRSISTAILYLVIPQSFSALHRVKSDEMFHFYSGDPAEMIQIDENGNVQHFILGSNIFAGESPQVLVPRGVWQGLRLRPGGKWALMGTTVAPGFEFEDFEVGERDMMIQRFPMLQEEIVKFTRATNEKAH